MSKSRVAAIAAAGAAAAAGILMPVSAASATTVPSPIGTITVEQYQGTWCDDFGADVLVATDGGAPNTQYTAKVWTFSTSSPTFVEQIELTFTTDAAGDGSLRASNVRTPGNGRVGTTNAVVSASGTAVSVDFPVNCRGNQGG